MKLPKPAYHPVALVHFRLPSQTLVMAMIHIALNWQRIYLKVGKLLQLRSTLTISKDDQRTQQFSIFAPESFTSGEIRATVTITSEDGATFETMNVDIQSARIDLSVDQTLSQELTKVYESQPGQLVVPITNDGYKAANTVLVSVNLTNDAGNEVIEIIGNQTISVGAGQTVEASFTLDESSKKFNRFAISVDVLGEDEEFIDGEIETFDYQEETILDTSEPTSGWFMVIIIALTILVGYGGLKVAKKQRLDQILILDNTLNGEYYNFPWRGYGEFGHG